MIKKFNEFDKMFEYTNSDMSDISKGIKKRGDTCFYIIDDVGFVTKYAITETMREGFVEFDDMTMGYIKDIGEFMSAIASEINGSVVLENEAEELLKSLKESIEGEADTDYLEDYPELESKKK